LWQRSTGPARGDRRRLGCGADEQGSGAVGSPLPTAVNAADNVLHSALSALGVIAG
jgi:hypothetical protein